MIEYTRFPGRIGFPLGLKTRYNSSLRTAIGPAKFRAYIPRTERWCRVEPFPQAGNAVARDRFTGPVIGPVTGRDQKAEYDVDIYTIIFLALAVFIFLRLRNVLGQRTGSERPPFDRAARNTVPGAADNVVPIPGKVIDQAPLAPTAEVTPPTDRWKGLAESGSALAQGLDAIAARDSSFDPKHFLSGARGAYEMIVLAFANGDRRALRDLLSSEVFDSFETVMRDREKYE